MRSRAQLLGHQTNILIGLIIPSGDAGISHQGTDVCDGAVPLRVLLQPTHKLPDEVTPADAEALCADLPEQLHRALRERTVGFILILSVLHQNAALKGAERPQPFQQIIHPCSRFVDRDLHHAKLTGLGKHSADQRAGNAQFPCNIALPLVLQIVPAGNIGEFFLLFLTEHGIVPPYICYICYFSITGRPLQGATILCTQQRERTGNGLRKYCHFISHSL